MATVKLHHPRKTALVLGTCRYETDENGIVEIPAEALSSAVWGEGWVLADGQLNALARAAQSGEPEAEPAPESPADASEPAVEDAPTAEVATPAGEEAPAETLDPPAGGTSRRRKPTA